MTRQTIRSQRRKYEADITVIVIYRIGIMSFVTVHLPGQKRSTDFVLELVSYISVLIGSADSIQHARRIKAGHCKREIFIHAIKTDGC